MKVEEKQFDLEYINKYASQMTIEMDFWYQRKPGGRLSESSKGNVCSWCI